jgi:hypothetical protein
MGRVGGGEGGDECSERKATRARGAAGRSLELIDAFCIGKRASM